MRAGDFRHVIRIEQPIERQDSTGAALVDRWEVWADNVRASIEPLRVREQFLAQQIQAEIDTFIRIRFRPGITEKMRIVHVHEYASSPQIVDVYDIVGPPMDAKGLRRELQLMCVRRSAEGFRSEGAPPTESAGVPITFDRTDITFDRSDITFDQTEE